MQVWDHAAGVMIVEEAGGAASDYKGGRLELSSGLRHFAPGGEGLLVSCGGALHQELLAAVAAAPQVAQPPLPAR